MNKLLKLPNQQLIRYIMTGGATTAVNYCVFIALTALSLNYMISNGIAWIFAVLFAYYVNKHIVFHAKGSRIEAFFQFISMRLITLLLESALLFAGIEWLKMPELGAKITVSIVTVVLNYLACKYSIFKERGLSHELQK